ncbi:unnamed protein product [Meloidogyne enterolobii]|uniref:Uncharacterized protein n=1 Tax=Meloidogyne enterolobii TaxID=390850 RepID=A0ACB0Y542_MELEN
MVVSVTKMLFQRNLNSHVSKAFISTETSERHDFKKSFDLLSSELKSFRGELNSRIDNLEAAQKETNNKIVSLEAAHKEMNTTLKSEIHVLKAEQKAEFAVIRSDNSVFKSEMTNTFKLFKSEVKEDLNKFKSEVKEDLIDMKATLKVMDSKFIGIDGKLAGINSHLGGVIQRVISIGTIVGGATGLFMYFFKSGSLPFQSSQSHNPSAVACSVNPKQYEESKAILPYGHFTSDGRVDSGAIKPQQRNFYAPNDHSTKSQY